MQDSTKVKSIMRRRGRPRKSEMEKSTVRKPRALRLTDDETKVISDNALRCRMNFSEYCRKVLLGYHPCVPDPEFRDGLLAARKDMVNFINVIRGMKMTKEERAKQLVQVPTLKVWLNSMAAEIEFIDKQMKRM